MEELASCDMCVVEVSLEPRNLRVKLGYYAEAMRLAQRTSSATKYSYNYPLPTPGPDDLQDVITVLLPASMAHDFEVGDYLRMTLTPMPKDGA